MVEPARYQIEIGNFLTEEFDVSGDVHVDSIIADICTGRDSISNLPPDTEITITAPDGSIRTTTLEQCKRSDK
jgi:hypothetical protein